MNNTNNSSKFYFTIIDDTDDAFLENIKPTYEHLIEHNIKITKTVWVYPPRDRTSKGDSLQSKDYLDFIRKLNNNGFEIALHNVGSGDYKRDEILVGLEEFKDKLGFYPKIHINHSYNKDSIYGGYKRFNFPFRQLIKSFYPQYSGDFSGEIEGSEYFWGDKHKEIIKFNRNHETDNINTKRFDRFMPYIDPHRNGYSNFWFSVTFAPNQWIFNHIINKKTIDKLEKENGICIVSTHLGYFNQGGVVDKGFKEIISYLSQKKNGIYIPVSSLLEEIINSRKEANLEAFPVIPASYKFFMELKHLITRVKYRKLLKIDDYAFKNLDKEMFVKK